MIIHSIHTEVSPNDISHFKLRVKCIKNVEKVQHDQATNLDINPG